MAGWMGRAEHRSSRRLDAARVILLAGALLSGCGSGGSAVNAAVNTAVAVGAAAYERSEGGCLSNCVPGTHCNEETGYCDPVPCDGRCRPGEICRETVMGEQCERWPETEMPPGAPTP
jgi:hypothetical protein